MIQISLICATKGRTVELDRLLKSLTVQNARNFELVLIDQNSGDEVEQMLKEYAMLTVRHMKRCFGSNTEARNFGIQVSAGNWVGFPDDDCWYPPDFIDALTAELSSMNGINGYFVNWRDFDTSQYMFSFPRKQMQIEDAFNYASCICIFFKKSTLTSLHGFDTRFGLGDSAIVNAGEEQDLLLRAIATGARIAMNPTIHVYHKIGAREWNATFVRRVIGQGACEIYFNFKYYGVRRALGLLFLWTGGMLYNFLRFRKQNLLWYYYKVLGGIRYAYKLR